MRAMLDVSVLAWAWLKSIEAVYDEWTMRKGARTKGGSEAQKLEGFSRIAARCKDLEEHYT